MKLFAKKITSILLSVALMAGIICMPVSAAEIVTGTGGNGTGCEE